MAQFPGSGGISAGTGVQLTDSGVLTDGFGNIISTNLPAYANGDEPNPWKVPKYTEILTDPSCLTGTGATTLGIKRQSDGELWKFSDGGQILYSAAGAVGAPLVSGIAGTGAQVNMLQGLNQPMIPANMMYKGFRGRIKATVIKTGATATWIVYVRIGKTAMATSFTTNDTLYSVILQNFTDRQGLIDFDFTITSAGVSVASALVGDTTCKFTSRNYLPPNGQATTAVVYGGNNLSTLHDAYININITGTAGDTFSLVDYSIIAMPL